MTSAIFCYDANGNMTQKIDGSTTSYTYDAENRMVSVSGAASATFVYDGDGRDLCTPERSERGNRVKGVVGGVTTTYIGNYFEWSGSTTTMKKYYYAGGTRVAERKGTTLYWLLSDHLGSTSITATSSGSKTAELRYKPWGETRYTYGTTQTTIRYTGQREESSLGLYWYASRWYSPGLGRFVSPDTIIPQPGNPMAWDRYAYVYSNPINRSDPSGHCPVCLEIAIELLTNLLIQDLRDGSFDTPNDVRTAVSVTTTVLTENPFGSIRDQKLLAELASQSGSNAPDLTNWLVDAMVSNAKGPIAETLRNANNGDPTEVFASLVGWTGMVKGGGPWDFKVELNPRDITAITLGGVQLSFDTLANIHYGFLGASIGYSSTILQAGAGLAQITAGTSDLSYWNSWFDDPQDQAYIMFGYSLYKKYGTQLTTEQFTTELQKFLKREEQY